MKKLFFLAMVCIAFAGSALASNEVIVMESEIIKTSSKNSVIYFDNCTVKVSYWNSEGQLVHTGGTEGTVNSYSECKERLNNILIKLNSWGYKIESYTMSYGEFHEI